MAHSALSLRDSTLLLLGNAAPGQPRSSLSTSTSSRARFTDTPSRLHSSKLCTDCKSFRASILSNRTGRSHTVLASVESNVTVEEPPVNVALLEPTPVEGGVSETATDEPGTTESLSAPANVPQKRNPVQGRAGGPKPTKNITVQKEQLLPGAVFSGTVRAVQAYGAFIDIGAYTDGLVHISELSSTYVRNVQDVVSVGQAVTVTVIEMDERAGRISLTMRDKDSEVVGGENEEQSSGSTEGGEPRRKIAGRGAGSTRGKRDENRKVTKLTKGQELKGKVKNIIRSGAFIEFENGEEGYLRGSEITEGGENVPMETLLTVGQEVNVRVLKIERGKANLTMKAQVDMKSINKSINKSVNGDASNPFEVFFRDANLIPEAPVLEDSAEEEPSAKIAPEPVEEAEQAPMLEKVAASVEAEQTPEAAAGEPVLNVENASSVSGGSEAASSDEEMLKHMKSIFGDGIPVSRQTVPDSSVDKSPLSVLDSLIQVSPLPEINPLQGAVPPLIMPDPLRDISPLARLDPLRGSNGV